MEAPVLGGCHAEDPVAQRVEVPVSTSVLPDHPVGDAVDDRLQLQREGHPEESLGDIKALILGDGFPGDREK